jgi:hypothetical protein
MRERDSRRENEMGFRREPTGNPGSRQSKCSARRLGEAFGYRRELADAVARVLRRDGHGCCVGSRRGRGGGAMAVPSRSEPSSGPGCRCPSAAHPIRARLRRPIDQDSVLVEELQPGSSIVTQRRVCAGLESTELKSRKYTSDGGAAHVMANAHTTCDRVSRLTILVFA